MKIPVCANNCVSVAITQECLKTQKYVKQDVVIQVKEEGWRAGRAAPRDFPRAKPEENPEEQPCKPKENPIHPDSFTWIYIIFKKGHFQDYSEVFKY